jgi:hypothetical protein
MSRPRINVTNHDRWGLLVKTWATGKNYVDHDITREAPFPTRVETPPKFPKPTSFKEFVDQCVTARVGLFFEDGQNNPAVTANEDMGLVVLQVTSETMVLRLPAKEKIEESEENLRRNAYVLPEFYRILFEKDRNPDIPDVTKKATLHAQRVGEYTINTCM